MPFFGAAMLVAAVALVVLFRSRPDGRENSLVSGAIISALFPTVVLGMIAFGVALMIAGIG